jgi:DNA-binding GntR family transcriptional regulator
MRTSASAAVSDKLRADIIDGEFPVGSRLKIDYLAERYATSHMPVREALRILEAEGLVVNTANRGAHVRAISPEFVRSLFDVRTAMGAMLARRAAEQVSPADLARLNEIEGELERAAEAGDEAAVEVANRAFHDLIEEAAAIPEAVQLANRHWGLFMWLWRRFNSDRSRHPEMIADHRHLLFALARRDGDAAAILMAAHATKACQSILAKLADESDPSAGRRRGTTAPAAPSSAGRAGG